MSDLLLHICCAPDAAIGFERLTRFGDLLGFFFNPNIEPIAEYRIRETEARRLSALLEIPYIEVRPNRAGWQTIVSGYECEPERGERCRRCIAFNLQAAAEYAVRRRIPAFATTLTASPFKDIDYIHETGNTIADDRRLTYIEETLRKKGGYVRSRELSRKYGIYIQSYCGCRWSLADSYRKKGLAPEKTELAMIFGEPALR
jgi:predicted adenine nucleotide alpha hydrolase (AANH) superfamily ATPase